MPESLYNFYECDNPQCGLRFPGYGGYPRWNLCPLCRSKTHVVEKFTTSKTNNDKRHQLRKIPVNVLLDNIRSALNVGSIFRTSDGGGVQKIHLCGITPNPENPKVRKTALGAENNIEWEQSNNGLITAVNLQNNGYQLWVLEDLPESIPLYDIEFANTNSPLVLIVGNEVTGVDPGIIRIGDKLISIPMLGKKSSYNVAIAFGIAISFICYRFGLFNSDKMT